jgi:acetate kinase
MGDAILVINAGSSSIKFAVFAAEAEAALASTLKGTITGIGTAPRFLATRANGETLVDRRWDRGTGPSEETLLEDLVDWIESQMGGRKLAAAGHRVVHGGAAFHAPTVIDSRVMDSLEKLIPLAPLQQPHNLAAIKRFAAAHPRMPQVACFDTAFHAARGDTAMRFALPRALHDAGIRRYGFHGLSYEYIARSLARDAPLLHQGRVVVAHLGNGASLCAMRGGISVDSTMGFTALEGLPMGTRCGRIDPGVLLYLLNGGMSVDALQRLLYNESGLLGVSGGVSSDMRELLASKRPEAAQAVDLFVYRVLCEIGAMAAALGGLDGLVFTAGIGENAPLVRERICRGCEWLGIELDPSANAKGARRITSPASRASAWVIPTNEEEMIALHTIEAVEAAGSSGRGVGRELAHA